jgi:hypothetical protein
VPRSPSRKTVRRRVRSFERSSSRIGDLHANDVNRPFASSACFAQGCEAISKQASEQDFADATREQISVGVPVDGFREEAKGAKQIRSFHDRWYPPPHLSHLGVPLPASKDSMGCDRGARLSGLWIPLHPVQLCSHAARNAALASSRLSATAAVRTMRRLAPASSVSISTCTRSIILSWTSSGVDGAASR